MGYMSIAMAQGLVAKDPQTFSLGPLRSDDPTSWSARKTLEYDLYAPKGRVANVWV